MGEVKRTRLSKQGHQSVGFPDLFWLRIRRGDFDCCRRSLSDNGLNWITRVNTDHKLSLVQFRHARDVENKGGRSYPNRKTQSA